MDEIIKALTIVWLVVQIASKLYETLRPSGKRSKRKPKHSRKSRRG